MEERILTKDRIMEYATMDGLTKMTGVTPEMFDIYIIKELIDNSLDACELYNIQPKIKVTVKVKEDFLYLSVADNGPGLGEEQIKEIVNFTRYSGTKYYVKKPTRGAQGNALMTILGLPGILSYVTGKPNSKIIISTQQHTYLIKIIVDKVMQEIKPEITKIEPTRKSGTQISIILPLLETKLYGTSWTNNSHKLWGEHGRYYDLIEGFSLWNPHVAFKLRYNNKRKAIVDEFAPTITKCRKFSHPGFGSVYWYKEEDFIDLVYANIRANKEQNKKETIINFAKRFKGCTGNRTELTRALTKGLTDKYIDSLNDDKGKKAKILFQNLKEVSKPLNKLVLGEIGREHFYKVISKYGVIHEKLFQYGKINGIYEGIPYVMEVAICKVKKLKKKRVQFGINMTVTYDLPFGDTTFTADLSKRDYRGSTTAEGLQGLLEKYHIDDDSGVFVAMHVITPNVRYKDYGKSEIEE
jgi:hypothetical protein